MLRVGIVGAGYIAEAHARGYAALPAGRVRPAAVFSRRFERAAELARRFDADAVHDFAALLEQVDAVSICTPTLSHAEYALAAIEAGKHVLCEKPLARTQADAERMVQAARAAGVKLMAAHLTRYEVDHRQAREVLLRGDLGRLVMASHSVTGPLPGWSSDGWFADPAQSGGPLLDLAIHSFDYLMWLFDSPVKRVYAAGHSPGGASAEAYALVSLRFENGGLGLVETSWAHPPAQGLMLRAELVGTQGRLSWDYEGIASMLAIGGEAGRQAVVMAGEDSFLDQVAGFVRCIEEDTPPPITGEEGLQALRVALAAIESFDTGRAVDL